MPAIAQRGGHSRGETTTTRARATTTRARATTTATTTRAAGLAHAPRCYVMFSFIRYIPGRVHAPRTAPTATPAPLARSTAPLLGADSIEATAFWPRGERAQMIPLPRLPSRVNPCGALRALDGGASVAKEKGASPRSGQKNRGAGPKQKQNTTRGPGAPTPPLPRPRWGAGPGEKGEGYGNVF